MNRPVRENEIRAPGMTGLETLRQIVVAVIPLRRDRAAVLNIGVPVIGGVVDGDDGGGQGVLTSFGPVVPVAAWLLVDQALAEQDGVGVAVGRVAQSHPGSTDAEPPAYLGSSE